MNVAATSLVLQQPLGKPAELVLLAHGVGAGPADMVMVGLHVARTLPDAMVVSVAAPLPSDLGRGMQWFSVQGITDANRVDRVRMALPRFVDAIEHWQPKAGVGAQQTTLIGFSQGAIMALAAAQMDMPPAHCIVSIAGRLAGKIERMPSAVRVHLLHGESDPVIPVDRSVDASMQMRQFGATHTLDTFPALGHGVDERVLTRISQRLLKRPIFMTSPDQRSKTLWS